MRHFVADLNPALLTAIDEEFEKRKDPLPTTRKQKDLVLNNSKDIIILIITKGERKRLYLCVGFY